ncbi:MAG: acyl carrier protein [Pirellulaceae bacterium]|nr:MAG: acyl carrier protein [Pirellulaceae bacterium]
MGLDGVELLMDVEEHFGISIQDAEAEAMGTVGDLISLISARLSAAQRIECPTARAFFDLRRLVRTVATDDSLRIRPRDRVTEKLAPATRKRLWEQLDDLLGTHPPELCRAGHLRWLLVLVGLVCLASAFLAAIAVEFTILPLTLAIAVAIIALLNRMTLRFRNFPPQGWATFGEIAIQLAGTTAATKKLHLRSDDDILHALRPLVVNALGVDESEVVPSARFVEDLGMGT